MPNFGLFRRGTGLNEAIVRDGPIGCVMTLASMERHLTVLHAYPIDLYVTRSNF